MELSKRKSFAPSSDGRGTSSASGHGIVAGDIDLPEWSPPDADMEHHGQQKVRLFYGPPWCQIGQKILLGMCLFLIVSSAFFSIYITHIYRIGEEIDRLEREIADLDSSMQIREFRGVVHDQTDDKEKMNTCKLNFNNDHELESELDVGTSGVTTLEKDKTQIQVNTNGTYKLKFWAVKQTPKNVSCTTLLMANHWPKKGEHTQMRKFNCPENANQGDEVAWQTLVCLSNVTNLSIRMPQGTSAFRCEKGGQMLSLIVTLMGEEKDCWSKEFPKHN